MSENLKRLIYKSVTISSELQTCIDGILGRTHSQPGDNPANPKVFLRLNKLGDVMNGNTLKPDSYLAGPPFVFLTLPQEINGLALRESLYKVGYSSSDIEQFVDSHPMAALVFKYPDEIQYSSTVTSHWQKQVFPSTWENVFELVEKLSSQAGISTSVLKNHSQVFFSSSRDRDFACSFPDEGKLRLRGVPYQELEKAGGDDWYYRQEILRRRFEITELFNGKGKTWCEKPELGNAQEFLGPNFALTELSRLGELAVVHLGSL